MDCLKSFGTARSEIEGEVKPTAHFIGIVDAVAFAFG